MLIVIDVKLVFNFILVYNLYMVLLLLLVEGIVCGICLDIILKGEVCLGVRRIYCFLMFFFS